VHLRRIPRALRAGTWLASLCIAAPVLAGSDDPSVAMVTRVDEAPTVDGWIDEAYWRSAAIIGGFVQQRPRAGQPAGADTRIRLLATTHALYLAFECDEPDPRGVLARSLGRDVDLSDEDHFVVALDTFDDDQTGVAFHVNPNGARTDLLIRADGEYLNTDWDGMWSASCRVTDEGWQGEIEIPWHTLRFDAGNDVRMGVNFARQRRHVNEQSHWVAVPRPFDVYRVSLGGALVGLGAVDPGRNIVARPFVLGRAARGAADESGSYSRDRWDHDLEAGLDVKVGIRSSLTLDLTFNTDFAQVEIDDELVNLTRFPLFFPEKREFFLERANLFRFGSPSNLLFYSRSIGLDDQGRTVSLRYGSRLTGRIGSTEIGLMDIEQSGERGLPRRRFDVLRVRQDIGTRSSIGLMAVQRSSGGSAEIDEPTHRGIGFDGDVFPTESSIVSIYGAVTREDGLGADDATWGGRARWSHSLGVLTYIHESIGADYAPRMGFVERTGVEIDAVGWEFTPEPDGRFIRRFENQGFFYWIDRRHGPFESRYVHVNPVIVGPSEQRLSIYWERDFDRIFAGEEFALDEMVFAAGDYTYDYWGLALETDPSHWWNVGAEGVRGDFFDGAQERVQVSGGVRRAPHWTARLQFERARIERDESGTTQLFDSDLVRLRLGWAFTNAFTLQLFTQYNATSDLVLSQLRAHWIFGDESDLYLVVADARDDHRLGWTPRRSELTLKLSYARQL
jgi:hypothetical protein